MKRAAICLACGAILGCTSSDSDPVDYSPAVTGPTNPVTCDYLVKEAPLLDGAGHFVVDGGSAGCAVNGLECALGPCDAGTGTARCMWNTWIFHCGAVADSGPKEAGGKDAVVDLAQEN